MPSYGSNRKSATNVTKVSVRQRFPVVPKDRDEQGFTLIELLIVTVIIPIVIGAIGLALLTTLKVQTGVSDRLAFSGNTQVISSNYFKDVQAATAIYAPNSGANPPSYSGFTDYADGPLCVYSTGASGATGIGPILELEQSLPAALPTVVAYSVQTDGTLSGGTSRYMLVRSVCNSVKPSSTPTTADSSTIIADNVPPNLIAVINCSGSSVTNPSCFQVQANTRSSWQSSAGVESVSLMVNEILSNGSPYQPFTFTIGASPRVTSSNGTVPSGGFSSVPPIQLLATSGILSGCKSGANIKVNGPMVLSGATTTAKSQTWSAAAVYYVGKSPPSSSIFIPDESGRTPSEFKLATVPPDPLSGLPEPSYMTDLTPNPPPVGGVFQPGYYTGATLGAVNLAPGIYYFGTGSGISMTSGQLIGHGVMLFFAAGSTFSVGGSSNVSLSPTLTGPYAGVTMFFARNNSGDVSMSGNASFTGTDPAPSGVTGVVYLPRGNLALAGTAAFDATNLIADNITCAGGGSTKNSINLGYFDTSNVGYATSANIKWPTKELTAIPLRNSEPLNTAVPLNATPVIPGDTRINFSTDFLSQGCVVQGSSVTFTLSGKQCIVDVNEPGIYPYYSPLQIQVTGMGS